MADVTLTYKGSTIAEMNNSGTKTLKTSGKYCEGDIGVSYVKPSSGGSGELALKMITGKGTITELPSDITTIRNGAFYNCTNITLTSLPSGITSIGDYAFYNCKNLALTSMPSVSLIGEFSFWYCSSLNINTISASNIGRSAFAYCYGLTEITINGKTTINNFAFDRCGNLTKVTFNNSNVMMGNSVFSNCTNLTDIYVPWAEGAVLGAPWGATNATIHYNTTT